MMSDVSNTEPTQKVFEIKTENRIFEIGQTGMQNDGSFPQARQLKAPSKAIAKARRKIARELVCSCGHGILGHCTDSESFMMFLFGESIPTFRFLRCSIEKCRCQRFVSLVRISDLEVSS